MPTLRLIVILGLSLIAVACSTDSDQTQATSRRAPRVVVAPVLEKSVPLLLEYVGNIMALETAEIRARVTGDVIGYHFREGEDVSAGQLLFTIDPRPFQAIRDQATATLAEDEAELAYAREQVVRYAGLARDEFITEDDFDRYRTTVAALEAEVKADRAAIALAQLDLDYCFIRAPFDGRAGRRLVDPGNLVTAGGGSGDPTLVVVKQIDPIKVMFAVPERDLPRIREADRAKTLGLEVVVSDREKRPFEGSLWLVDNQVDTSTGMIVLEGMLPNPERLLWPGQFVAVRLRVATRPDALVVPSAAISVGQQGSFVFIVSDKSKVERRLIETDAALGNETIVSGGVRAGERVVVEGQAGLQSGMQVEPRTP